MDLLHAYDSPSMFGSAADWEVELHTTAMATTTTLDSPAIDGCQITNLPPGLLDSPQHQPSSAQMANFK
jgi:hypothetical protein